MCKILYLTNVIRRLGVMQQTMEKLQAEQRLSADCQCCWIANETNWQDGWETKLRGTKLLLLKWMGTGLDTPFLKKLLAYLQGRGIPYYVDAEGAQDSCLVQALTSEQVKTIEQYASFGGEKNYYHLWLYAQQCLSDIDTDIPKPNPVHWCGIFHPDAENAYTDLELYQKEHCAKDKMTIGMLFYRDEWVWGDLEYQTSIIREIERQGMNAICVFSNGLPEEKLQIPSLITVFDKFFSKNGVPVIDVLLNTQKFSMTSSGSMTVEYLKQWDLPILEAYSLMTEYKEWKDNLEGMNAMEISIGVSLPEFDGVIHGIPIANKRVCSNGDVRYVPIPERIERLVSKAGKWAALRHKNNAEKKIAIIFHNYPPTNSNIGSAFGLDSIESVRRLLKLLQERGYRVDNIPEDSKSFIEELTSNATNDRSMLNEKQLQRAEKIFSTFYQSYFDRMEESVQKQLVKDWGECPGEIMAYDNNLLVPGTVNGNVFVTVQPPRGFGEDPSKIYHSPFCAPTHHYLAFYQWLRDVWQADAAAHIGTHGSLEWLPGKNAGLAATCYPDLALGDLPNIYPYNITITGEGVQAKRRGAACLVEHLPAPQSRAGVYDEIAELEKLMDDYAHFAKAEPENLPTLENLILNKVQEANLQDEVLREEEEAFEDYILRLHNYITDLKNMAVHTGLHILGQSPQNDGLIEYLLLLTRLDNGNIPSLNQAVAELYGFDYYELLENSGKIYEPLDITYSALIDRIGEQSREIIQKLYDCNFTSAGLEQVLQLVWLQNIEAAVLEKLKLVCKYICESIYPKLLLTTQEMDNILRGFDGCYIEPGPSGAPSSGGADLLPTGRNFYGVDPRTLPTPAAWEIGKTLGDQVITRFIEEEGRYPESIGIVLWSGANMRSRGQCIAEFLYLLGVKPKYQKGSLRVNGLEVIPLHELQRPRIDVTARISGLFRDSMPAAVQLLDRAVLLVSKLDEPEDQNYVRKHVLADSQELVQDGVTEADAWREAAFRIFGDEQGVYGAGVAALLDAQNWETIDDIADVYVRWGAHAYGGKTKGRFLPTMFRKRMGSLDVTIKNEDNHETNMLSSDDYNAYHGGMIAAVRSIKGSAPRSYCGDSSDRTKVVMHSVQEQAKRIFRSEAINPKFIEGMMKHGYKGAADMANMLAHSYQWDATSAVMEDWMYEKYAEKYLFDASVQEWLKDVNPWAMQRMTETLLEAEQRGLWQAKPETKAELQKLCLEMEGELEERVDSNE